MGKSRRWLNTMRSLLISLVLLVLSVQADDFKGQKVTLGKRKCTCDFRLDMKEACKGTAKCDKKCSGAGKVEVGGCSFVLQVKKGAGKISKCACDAAQPTIGPVTGSGSGPAPPTGSGSGPSPPIGSGSGEQPVPLPGSGSGPQPPAGGESMQCGCKCDCPQGTGECDCDCNCPMNSQAVNCAPGFSKVCPMMGDQCPEYMEQVCPSMPTTMPLPAGRMMGAGDRGCQCVPDFLLSLVMGAMTPAGRPAAMDRAMTKVTFKIGKTTCKCQYEINQKDCKRSKMACDKKCNGKISGLELEDGNYVMSLMVKKGKVAIQKCEAKTTEPTGTGGGPGSGPGNGGGSGMGSGPGSGMGGGMGGMGTRCACVSMGGGPMPPTGSGSGPMPPTGSGPNPPTGTGSGSGPEPPTGSGVLVRKELSDYPKAVCNDGSNATYYYSDNAFSADHLLIYLQGGGSCQDVQSCNLRCNNPDSAFRCTAPQDETVPGALNFLLEDEDLSPPFYDFGKIYVPYCSSDIWIGTADANPENGNYFFHGKDIVRAVVDDLKKVTNMAGMNQIVLLGTSAGGFGTQNVCDFVADKFKAENSNVDVRCIADSGDLVPPVGLNCTPEVDAQSFWGGESDESCMNAGAACGNFVTLYNYIETPLMVVHNYIDPTVSGQCAPALDASNIDYWNQWRQEIETLASEVMLAKPDNGFFIPNCYFHVLTKNEKAWNRLPVPLVGSDNEILLKDIIKNWTTGTGPVVAIDDPLVSNSNCGTPPSGF